MPATEQTWRSPSLLHIVFGATSFLMLVATIWMFAKDHTREWKDYQKAHNAVSQFYTKGREYEARSVQFANQLAKANADLAEAQALPVRSEDVAEFKAEVDAEAERLGIKPFDLSEAEVNAQAADDDGESDDAVVRRERIVEILDEAIAEAKHREDTLLQERKFAAANVTAELSLRDIAVHEGRSDAVVAERQAKVDASQDKVDELSVKYEAVTLHRKKLESIKKRITDPVSDAEAQVVKVKADVQRYQDGIEGFTQKLGRTILGMPILDAFDNSDLTIDQIWLPDLKISYNFSSVARFDRCITCHRANDTSKPGAPTDPAYETQQAPFTVMLSTPDEMPQPETEEEREDQKNVSDDETFLTGDDLLLREAYGLMLAKDGILNANDVTVQVVWPKVGEDPARAAEAGLQMGDVITAVGGSPVLNRSDALARLVGEVTWGQPVELTIRRGLPHPFASHPRLDLFCGSTSPHQQGAMGCTICHDGQGSATAFKWASHTPNNPTIAEQWDQEHGWFDNHHWIFPMYPKRFVESGCLKCHHEVVELSPSEKFPEPPAPKLMAGYELVREYGCFGCHEINGYDGPDRRIGPDLRAEPNFYAVAQALLLQENLTPEETSWAEELVHHPERDQPRRRLFESIQMDQKLRASEGESNIDSEADEPGETEDEKLAARFTPTTYRLGSQLKDVESPGRLRKPGPSLRYVASKADFDFLYDWIRKPASFRPSTKMPQFFGLWSHLSESEQEETSELEAMEIRGITKYLVDASNPFEYDAPEEGITAEASVARGAYLFQTRGCLACHAHDDYPGINNNQGPDLTMLAAKFGSENGKKWLYTWLKDPSKYHVRTKMPNMLLDPVTSPDGEVSDPIADIVAFLVTTGVGFDVAVDGMEIEVTRVDEEGPAAGKLQVGDILTSMSQDNPMPTDQDSEMSAADVMASLRGAPGSKLTLQVKPADSEKTKTVEITRVGYKPESVPAAELSKEEQETLYKLALQSLKKAYPMPVAKRYLEEGITDIDPGTIKGDDIVLVGEMNESNRTEKMLLYVGRRAISKYGCSGCHDIPGYEDAKPIGTGLADWGRKDASRLAFEQITQFLPLHGGDHAASHAAHGDGPPYELTEEEIDTPDTQFFFEAISHHNRQGFIWQKLRQPRSYDYQKVSNKEYNDRLRMPQFPFNDEEREQVITFVLGLVAEPPAEKYIYAPDPRQDAIVKGRQVLEKFNCAGCHSMSMEQWEIAFMPDDENYEEPPELQGYPFLKAHATSDEMEDSLETDAQGMRHATIHGRPLLNEESGLPLLFNEDLDPVEPGEESEAESLYYSFELWGNAVINGHMFQSGGPSLLVKDSTSKKYPAWGGSLSNYLFPIVIADEKNRNPQVKGSEAWGWLPPPLVGEGEKVQTNWLHNFLLDPTPIRPAVVLRMPKFNMSPDDATALANYFAAVDNAGYPYEFDSRTASDAFAAMEEEHPGRLKDALGIVVNNTYCVKCHLVGDFMPGGSEKAMGPNLADVYERLRPEYTRRWIADPRRILPYTGMPVNIPYKPEPPVYGGIAQDIFKGTSFEQLDGLVDLLMNYDVFSRQELSIKPMVKAPPAEGEGEAVPEGGQDQPAAEVPAETPAADDTPAAEGASPAEDAPAEKTPTQDSAE